MYTLASEETFKDGQVIIREGSPGDWVYVILSGSVEISRTVQGKTYVIETLRQGEVFGEIGFIGGGRRSATAKAIGETTVGVIDRGTLDHEFNKLSSEFRSILVSMVKRFQKMIDRAVEYTPRRDPRVPKVLSLAYKDRQSFVKAYTSNISSGGIFVKTDNPFNQGEQFLLKLQLPDLPEPLKIQCEVAWERGKGTEKEGAPPGMGVRFVEMSQKDDELLKGFLSDTLNW